MLHEGRSRMSSDLDALLCARSPVMLRQRRLPSEGSAPARGFTCGDGWCPVIDQIFAPAPGGSRSRPRAAADRLAGQGEIRRVALPSGPRRLSSIDATDRSRHSAIVDDRRDLRRTGYSAQCRRLGSVPCKRHGMQEARSSRRTGHDHPH